METKKRVLGSGFEQLFDNENLDLDTFEKTVYETATREEIIDISLSELRANPYQPRKVFDPEALQELANSIKEHGVFQPIIVKESIKGYEIIAGERRVRASKLAGLDKIPAIVRNLNDNQMMEIALLENLQRENLSAIEEASAYKTMIEKLGLTQEQLSARVGKSRSHITNMLGILTLPEEVKDKIMAGKISMGHARVLSKIDNPDKVKELADKIVVDGLSVRATEELSNSDGFTRKNHQVRKTPTTSYEYKELEETLKEKLGTNIKIKNNKLEISFANQNDLNRILEIIGLE